MSRTRALLAVAFVAVVSGLLALRGAGYLGGRATGGPLRVTIRASGDGVARLRGDAVRIQNVRPHAVSPGLAVDGPTIAASGRPLKAATLRAGRTPLRMRLAAGRPGVYYAVGLITDYRRGQRRFRDRERRVLCVAVGRRRCDPGYDGPGSARVAQVGGPSAYPGARLAARAATYTRPGDYRVRLTILNRTRSIVPVRGLALDGGAAAPSFELDRHGSRTVRLGLRVRSCAPRRIDHLRGEVGGKRRSVPLSLPLRVRCGG